MSEEGIVQASGGPPSSPARDALDDKVNRLFAGKVVRKDLVRKVKVGANVPVFVLEYLLGKYCASSDETAIQMGMQVEGSLGRHCQPVSGHQWNLGRCRKFSRSGSQGAAIQDCSSGA